MTASSLMSLEPSSVATGIREIVQDSIEKATPLRIAGRSHWISAGRPVNAEKILTLSAHSGVVDYVPGDLTITLKAGTTLRDLERITGEQGQWLPLDPHGDDDGTIGATIATGSFGPLAHSFGRARDLVLGVEFVAGDGRIVRGGGRVVKNVAGFDLTRMVTGSWGTIGVITEVTLRLYSLPPHPVSLALTVPDSPTGLAQRLKSLLALPINPFAVELVDSEIAGLTGLPCRTTILVALGGNRAAVAAQSEAINSLGGMSEIFPEVWRRLRIVDDIPAGTQTYDLPEPNIVFRISALPARIGEVWSALEAVMEQIPDGRMHASPGLGIVRCILPPSAGFEAVHSLTQACRRVTIVGESMPRELWPNISPNVVGDRVSQGIKRAFDPHNILNPGILGR